MNMNLYDQFKENNGYISLWLGNFKSEKQLDDYLSTVYWIYENQTESDFTRELESIFLPENKNREEEIELKKCFDESYNQFKYDFAIFFDEDFSERSFSKESTNRLSLLLKGHSYLMSFEDAFQSETEKIYNAVFLIYDCEYTGGVNQAIGKDFELDFIGAVKYDKS